MNMNDSRFANQKILTGNVVRRINLLSNVEYSQAPHLRCIIRGARQEYAFYFSSTHEDFLCVTIKEQINQLIDQ